MLRRFPLGYLAAVFAVAAARVLTGHPTPVGWGLTADALGAGRVWLLATSALIVNGMVVPQLIALALTIAVALRCMGPRFSSAVMVVSHVGATLLAYGILLAATGEADAVDNRTNDYGTSAVWLGLLGAAAVVSLARARTGDRVARVVVAAALVTAMGAVLLFSLMTATEHALAFSLGSGLALLREVRARGRRPARSGASTAFAPAAAASAGSCAPRRSEHRHGPRSR